MFDIHPHHGAFLKIEAQVRTVEQVARQIAEKRIMSYQ